MSSSLEHFTISSTLVGRSCPRHVTVYVPDSRRPACGWPLLLLHDGQNLFDPERAHASADQEIEREIYAVSPNLAWSVKNQARMHLRNGDAPYESVADAMRSWPETATAVAVRLSKGEGIEVNAPFGLDDLFALWLTPTPAFVIRKRGIFEQRVADKGWLFRYPRLQRVSA